MVKGLLEEFHQDPIQNSIFLVIFDLQHSFDPGHSEQVTVNKTAEICLVSGILFEGRNGPSDKDNISKAAYKINLTWVVLIWV